MQGDEYAPQGWYAKVDKLISLPRPLRMSRKLPTVSLRQREPSPSGPNVTVNNARTVRGAINEKTPDGVAR